jgi:hypothetical protein
MKSVFFIIILFGTDYIHAQHIQPAVRLVHYVFDEFSPGTVKMKSGEIFSQVLNYNILTNEMIFGNEGNYLAVSQPENVDTICIEGRKFIPLHNKFYEILVSSDMPLLLEFTASISEPGASTGYGGTSGTTASASFKSLVSSGGAYDLKLPDGFSVIPGFAYWIMKDNKLEKAGNEKQITKIFPDKKQMIQDLVKENHTNFSKREDIIKVIEGIE